MSLTDDGVENFRNQKKTKIKSDEELVMAFLVAKNKAKRLGEFSGEFFILFIRQ